jgi:hypothetical protein
MHIFAAKRLPGTKAVADAKADCKTRRKNGAVLFRLHVATGGRTRDPLLPVATGRAEAMHASAAMITRMPMERTRNVLVGTRAHVARPGAGTLR